MLLKLRNINIIYIFYGKKIPILILFTFDKIGHVYFQAKFSLKPLWIKFLIRLWRGELKIEHDWQTGAMPPESKGK